MIKIYGIEQEPYRLPMFLTPRTFVLEYVRKMIEIDNLHFVKSGKKGRTPLPIAMRGYVVSDKRGIEEIIKVLKFLDLPMDYP